MKIVIPLIVLAGVPALLLFVPAGHETFWTCGLCRMYKGTGSLASPPDRETEFTFYYYEVIRRPHEHRWESAGGGMSLNIIGYLFGARAFGGWGSLSSGCKIMHPICRLDPAMQVRLFESLPPEYYDVMLNTFSQTVTFINDMDLYHRLTDLVNIILRTYPWNESAAVRTAWLEDHRNLLKWD